MKGFHPNPKRDGYNLAGLLWIEAMIKYRRQIVAHTFRKYTGHHIRQLLSNLFNDNNLFLSRKHVALPTGCGCRIPNLGKSKSYIVRYLFALKSLSISIVVKLWQRRSLSFPPTPAVPPPRFWSWSKWLHVLPNCTYILIWTGKGQTGGIHFWIVR